MIWALSNTQSMPLSGVPNRRYARSADCYLKILILSQRLEFMFSNSRQGCPAGRARRRSARLAVRQADVTQITMQLGYQCCTRLIESGMLPGRDGQPLQLTAHVDLAELRALPGASGLEAGWSTARAAAAGIPGSVYLTGSEADAAACDAALTPVVTGHIDWNVLDHLTSLYLETAGHRKGPYSGADGALPELSDQTRERLQHTLLQWSIDLLSGPAGFPASLRTHLLPARFTSLSQPLDLGRTTRVIPPHLRKAVIQRDRKCRFPGCEQPPSVCQIHHLIPWSQGGATALGNLAMFCRYHHIIVIHRWGWKITCHPDGTTTATSPDGRILHSHGPPAAVA